MVWLIGLGVVALSGLGVWLLYTLLLPPKPMSTAARIRQFEAIPRPAFNKPLQIHWNTHQVPYIVAEDDEDAAFALGMVHAHLRLVQMEIVKRVAAGRISEMMGAATTTVDTILRTLMLTRPTQKILESMPQGTRGWMQAYTKGINHYKAHLKHKPHECRFVNVLAEPWRIEDSINLSRLAGTDVNWPLLLSLVPAKTRDNWEALWGHFLQSKERRVREITPLHRAGQEKGVHEHAYALLSHMFHSSSKSGSNSFAVGANKTETGNAMIASDPHLGFMLPNIWMVAGLKSPSYHMVGMMVPGMPAFAFGRNQNIAWGGTNLRAWNSDLVDVTDLPTEQLKTIKIKIKRRWWRDTLLEVKQSPYGPVISDLPIFNNPEGKSIALRWVGHEASDETTAMLDAMKAQNWDTFRAALKTFAVPCQNFIYADIKGNIGHCCATWVADRKQQEPNDIWQTPEEHERDWQGFLTALDLPSDYNPKTAIVATANNNPDEESSLPVGWYYSSNERIRRIRRLLTSRPMIGVVDLIKLQNDVISTTSFELKNTLVGLCSTLLLSRDQEDVIGVLASWTGGYESESKAAPIFEAWLSSFAPEFYSKMGQSELCEVWKQTGHLKEKLKAALSMVHVEDIEWLLKKSLDDAYQALQRGQQWGDVHRVCLQHWLSHLPVLGKHYRFVEYPAKGTQETVHKTAHPLTEAVHHSHYGSQARHISLMHDPNANYFSLTGGQDGWINSENFLDQVELWRKAEYMQVPLDLDWVKMQFPFTLSY